MWEKVYRCKTAMHYYLNFILLQLIFPILKNVFENFIISLMSFTKHINLILIINVYFQDSI